MVTIADVTRTHTRTPICPAITSAHPSGAGAETRVSFYIFQSHRPNRAREDEQSFQLFVFSTVPLPVRAP